MELYGADGDVEPRSDLLVSPVAHHGLKDLSLPRAQREWTRDRASVFEEFLRPGEQPICKRLLRRDENFEIFRIGPADQALHGQQAGHSLHGAIQIRAWFGSKLYCPCGFFAEKKEVGLVWVELSSVRGNQLRNYTYFFQYWPSRLAHGGQSSFDLTAFIIRKLQAELLRKREHLGFAGRSKTRSSLESRCFSAGPTCMAGSWSAKVCHSCKLFRLWKIRERSGTVKTVVYVESSPMRKFLQGTILVEGILLELL